VLAGLLLAWDAATTAFAHFHARSDPALALRLRPDDPGALSYLAGQMLVGRGRPRDLNAAEATARRVLRIAPLQSAALRDLGLIADARARKAQAAAIMERAGMRGFRDIPTQAWLLRHALLGRDFAAAALRLDAILRVAPEFSDGLFPVLLSMVDDPNAIDAVSRRLATGPKWRPAALLYLSDHARNPDQVIGLYQRLVRLGRPPTGEEANALMTRMTRDGRFDQAYLLWVSFLPQRALGNLGDLYDGNFQGLPGSPPFNWRLDDTPGNTAEIANSGESGDKALHVEYPVANGALLAVQLLVLPPGSYRLTGRYMVTSPQAGAHLSWILKCAAPPAADLVEARQAADVTRAWTPFSAPFTVPADCDGQWLKLFGDVGDDFGDLSAWYDQLAIQRVASGAIVSKDPSTVGARR